MIVSLVTFLLLENSAIEQGFEIYIAFDICPCGKLPMTKQRQKQKENDNLTELNVYIRVRID